MSGTVHADLLFVPERVLKEDHFGRVEFGALHGIGHAPVPAVRRDLRSAPLWTRPVASLLAWREARALRRLEGVEGVPRLLGTARGALYRSWIEGTPLHLAGAPDPAYHRAAAALVERIHRAGISHNDLHKQPNWLVTPDGAPALLDFQMASRLRGPGPWQRLLRREDHRHRLKHKRTHCPDALTPADHRALSRKSWIARGWELTVKPVYVWFTRRVLRWSDREGAGERAERDG